MNVDKSLFVIFVWFVPPSFCGEEGQGDRETGCKASGKSMGGGGGKREGRSGIPEVVGSGRNRGKFPQHCVIFRN